MESTNHERPFERRYIMSWFKKKGETHFERNEAGKIIATQHVGEQPRETKTPVSKALMKGYYKEHPEKTKTAKAIRFGQSTKKHAVTVGKAVDKWAVSYNRSQRGKHTPPLASYSFKNNANPFGNMFDTGMTAPKRKTSKSRTKYTAIGGKAYPIAGTSKKKKKKKKKSSTRTSSGFDIFDNSRFFK